MPLATASVGVREVTQAPALSAPGTIDGFPVELLREIQSYIWDLAGKIEGRDEGFNGRVEFLENCGQSNHHDAVIECSGRLIVEINYIIRKHKNVEVITAKNLLSRKDALLKAIKQLPENQSLKVKGDMRERYDQAMLYSKPVDISGYTPLQQALLPNQGMVIRCTDGNFGKTLFSAVSPYFFEYPSEAFGMNDDGDVEGDMAFWRDDTSEEPQIDLEDVQIMDIFGNRFFVSKETLRRACDSFRAIDVFNALHQQALRSIKESELLVH